jgi:SAM-dependent methyltransferase
MELLNDVRDLSRIGYGFMASKALFAALDLDLFTLLARQPSTLEDLASAAGIPAKRLQTLTTTLRALGLVGVGPDGRFFNSPAAASFLSKSSPNYYGDYFRFQIDRQVYPHLTGLLPAMHGLAGPPFYGLAVDPEEARHFSVAQHVGSMGPAHLLSRRLGAVPWRRLLDVAGGTGAFAITLCRRNPSLTATILDFPKVCDVAAGYLAEAGLTDRIALLRGDARATDWPANQDAVIMSYLLSAVAEADLAPLLRRAHASLAPGGTLIVHDFMVTDDHAGPVSAALWLLFNVVSDPDAPQLSPGMVIEAARAAGFGDGEEFELLPGITRVVMARKAPA